MDSNEEEIDQVGTYQFSVEMFIYLLNHKET